MKVLSTNTGERKTIVWKFKRYTTGIYKFPTEKPVYLGEEDVQHDVVYDRKHHGGPDKACYLFSADHYTYWKKLYPDLEWSFGMFGENLTVEGFDEQKISIGDTFEIGDAIVQVSEARQPCSNLNLRFQSSRLVKQFVEHGYCGAYLRVLKTGKVQEGDTLTLLQSSADRLSLFNLFHMLYHKDVDFDEVKKALNHPDLGIACKDSLRKFHRL